MLLGHIIHCSHGFCNFSHAQQGQLLPMSGEQTLGVGGTSITVGSMVDPIDVQKWITVLVRYLLADRHAGAVCLRDGSGLPDRSKRWAHLLLLRRGRPGHSQPASATAEFQL